MKTKLRIKDIPELSPEQIIVVSGSTYLFTYLNGYIKTTLENNYAVSNYSDCVLNKLLNPQSNDLDLSIAYFIERSSEKFISPLFYKLLKLVETGDMTRENMYKQLCIIIANKYAFKWYKIVKAFTENYKPLENYDMEEIRTPNLTENITRNQSTDIHQETESGIYGFNSTNSNPTATGEGDTTGLKANNETSDLKTNTGTESLTRHGNIGVTTSQQMLESEIKLRQYGLIEGIFKDIDSVLCLKIY